MRLVFVGRREQFGTISASSGGGGQEKLEYEMLVDTDWYYHGMKYGVVLQK